MAIRIWTIAGVIAVAIVGGAVIFMVTRDAAPRISNTAAAVVAPPTASPADCLLPGPPPVTPDGETASMDEMKLGHDNLQHFVDQLEAYQACRNAQIDHAAASVTAQQKDIWLQQGNQAIDEANEIAARFSAQRRVYNAKNGIQ